MCVFVGRAGHVRCGIFPCLGRPCLAVLPPSAARNRHQAPSPSPSPPPPSVTPVHHRRLLPCQPQPLSTLCINAVHLAGKQPRMRAHLVPGASQSHRPPYPPPSPSSPAYRLPGPEAAAPGQHMSYMHTSCAWAGAATHHHGGRGQAVAIGRHAPPARPDAGGTPLPHSRTRAHKSAYLWSPAIRATGPGGAGGGGGISSCAVPCRPPELAPRNAALRCAA